MQQKRSRLLFCCSFIIIMMIVYKCPTNLDFKQIPQQKSQQANLGSEEFSNNQSEENSSDQIEQSLSSQMEQPSTNQKKKSPSTHDSDKSPSTQSDKSSKIQSEESSNNKSEKSSKFQIANTTRNAGDDCRPLHFSEDPLPVTALYSFPGSGNTWLRHLLQQATGIYTGSIYNDNGLKTHGFPGEHIKNGSVIVVKLHISYQAKVGYFDRAIVLNRNPADAIRGMFNFRNTPGHTGHVPVNHFKTKEWTNFIQEESLDWETRYLSWSQFPGPLLFVQYENLVHDLQSELRRILDFLGQDVSDEVMNCVLNNKEGLAHRTAAKLNFDLYTPEMKKHLENIHTKILNQYKQRQDP